MHPLPLKPLISPADRKPAPASLIHHFHPRLREDGVQYALIEYRPRLADHHIAVSMSRPVKPYDNAKAESETSFAPTQTS